MKNIVENQDIKTDKPLPMSYEAMKAERDAQQKRADALAVENGVIKLAFKNLSNTVEEAELYGDMKYLAEPSEYEALADAIEETPATSAALAAIEARGVEKALAVVEACRGSICAGGLSENRQYEESIVHPHLDGIADELESLVNELREAK